MRIASIVSGVSALILLGGGVALANEDAVIATGFTQIVVKSGPLNAPGGAPLEVGLRQASAPGKVLLVWGDVFRDPANVSPPPATNTLRLQVWDASCAGGLCTFSPTFGPEDLADPLPFDLLQLPSVAIRSSPGGTVGLHVVRRDLLLSPVPPTCEGQALDLAEVTWNATLGPGAAEVVKPIVLGAVGDCTTDVVQPGVSTTRFANATVRTCFTHKPAGDVETIRCADRPLGSSSDYGPPVEVSPPDPSMPRDQDHSSMVAYFVDGHRVVAYRDAGSSVQQVLVGYPDQPLGPTNPRVIATGAPGDRLDYPNIELEPTATRLSLAYDQGDNLAGPGASRVGKVHTCAPFSDCAAAGFGPAVDVPDATGLPGLAHLELETLGDRQVLIFQANLNLASPGAPANWVSRVYYSERCLPDGPFSAPVVLREPTFRPEAKSQSLEFGRPRLVIDDSRRRAHVVLIETDTLNVAAASESALIWLTTEVGECGE